MFPMEPVIECCYVGLGALVQASERAGNPMKPTSKTLWFRIGYEACCGLYLGSEVPRWKAVFVDPAFRLRGYARAMLLHVCAVAREGGFREIQAISGTPDYLKALGFRGEVNSRGKWVGTRGTDVE
jgi:GNAT superfamily N-acetyltransferase